MILAYAVCNVSVMPLRAEPAHRSEQVSQLLFGERMEVWSKDKKDWLFVRCEWDGYEGWVKEGQVSLISYKEFRKPLQAFSGSAGDVILNGEHSFSISPGSSLFMMKKNVLHWNDLGYRFKGKKRAVKHALPLAGQIEQISKMFLGAPYLWGGRSIMGIDCSGFTQIVFKLMNIRLPRDASQQAQTGEVVSFLQEGHCGDLAFFDNEEGRINHVGILLNSHTIIHATDTSGCVVIDPIDNGGIISKRLKIRTHNMRLIKRVI